ncbi:MAG: hypothetical protein H0S79_19835 [Anaerolineaceae bacterium]|nr:hypothetical protein [Anaerolineaceae bacterium]
MTSLDADISDDVQEDMEGLESLEPVPPLEAGSRGFELETEGQIADSIDSLTQISEIQPENWEGLESDERLSALQSVEDSMSEIQNRPSVAIEAVEMGPGQFGGYDGNSIKINQEHLDGGQPVDENVDTIIHEGRHAYQEFVVNNPETITDQSVAQSWSDNFENYLDLQTYGAELYNSQPIEQDAWSYANSVRNGVYRK